MDFQNKFCDELLTKIADAGYKIDPSGIDTLIYDEVAVQAIIDNFEMPMPDLEPRQFKLMVAGVGLVPLIKAALDIIALATTDEGREMFKSAYSQYEGGTVYFWDKSLFEWRRLSPMFEILYTDVYGDNAPPFTLNEDDLREAWIAASTL
ncbi:hypothetical protein [Alkanindiges illinoisensis]|uniref:hypothetical protein n=1 Tax=Alkanindiges illinoisensis TaxID=197183 RepID=UPI00047D0AF5|nr:hypothetical protein [Alkanindiges illinoisensis]